MPKQYKAEGDINRVAAEGKYARRNQLVGMVNIDANAKTLAKSNQTEEQEDQAHDTKEYANPGK